MDESCVITFAFIVGTIYTMMASETEPPHSTYRGKLTTEQKEIYVAVTNERIKLSTRGLVLGLIVASLWFNYKLGVSPMDNLCQFSAIVLTVQYLFYNLAPKQFHMLPILTNYDQVMSWYDVYKFMKHRYTLGLMIGILVYFVMSELI